MDVNLKPSDVAKDAKAHSVAKPTRDEAENAVRTLLAWAGEDPNREGLLNTPARVVKAYGELFAGYDADVADILSTTFKDVGGYDDIVLVRDIPFHAHCEHHMVPFFGKAHIAYLPHEGVVGISKLARVTHAFAKRFQTQENLTAQIVDSINEHLNPRGAAILLEAEHMCMTMRGVRTPGTKTVTQRFTGVFAEDHEQQNRFFSMINSHN